MNPTTRIAQLSERSGYNRSTVAGWVGTARKKGYLPPARERKAGLTTSSCRGTSLHSVTTQGLSTRRRGAAKVWRSRAKDE